MQLHETEYGRRFFGTQLPKMIKALERIADALEEKKVQNTTEEVDVISEKPLPLRQLLYRIPEDTDIRIVDGAGRTVYAGIHKRFFNDAPEVYWELQQYEVLEIKPMTEYTAILLKVIYIPNKPQSME